jgi:hypothetical protein
LQQDREELALAGLGVHLERRPLRIGDAEHAEPFTSANSTVSCFRSPSRAAREVRILSAR